MSRPVTPLKVAIAKSGRTQRDIAIKLDISEEHLSRLVNGLHTTDDMRERIAAELRQSVDDLWPTTTSPERAA